MSGVLVDVMCGAVGASLVAAAAGRLGVPVGRTATSAVTGAAGVLSAVVGWRFDGDGALLAMLWFVCFGVALSAVDLRYHRLPDPLVGVLFAGGVVLLGVDGVVGGEGMEGLGRALTASVVVLAAGVLALLAGSGIGRGDVTFGAVLAMFTGAGGWQAVLFGLVLGALLLASSAAMIAAMHGMSRESRFAAGPSLFLGSVGAVLVLAPGG